MGKLSLLLISVILFGIISGCTSDEPQERPPLNKETSEETTQDSPETKPPLHSGPVNSKEGFYQNIKLLPVVAGYNIATISGFKTKLEEGPGLIIDYLVIGSYTSDSGDTFNVWAYKLRTGGSLLVKETFKKFEKMELDGTAVYINDEKATEGILEAQWMQDGILYTVGATTTNKDDVLEYAGLAIKSEANINPDDEDNEWMLLYQYLPEPLDSESLSPVTAVTVPAITGKYVTDELEYTLTIIPGEIGVALSKSELQQLSSVEEVQFGGGVATAGYKNGKYAIVYIDEEELISFGLTCEKGLPQDATEPMMKTLEAAMKEADLL